MAVILNRIRVATTQKRYKLLYRNHDSLARRLSSKDTHFLVKADAKGERSGPCKEEAEGNRSTVLRKLAIFTQQKSGTK